MAARYIIVGHDTPLLLPPDLREWVPENHLVHLVMDAVEQLDLGAAKVNERGTGDARYPPGMLLALLIYSYATGMFSSRAIERASYENVAVRLLCGDTHPDHDTVCAFRRRNGELLSQSFAQVIEMAARCGVLKVGGITVAIDGPKIMANASKHAAVSYKRAGQKMRQVDLEIAELLQKAEQADSTPLEDGLSIPEEVQRRVEHQAKLAGSNRSSGSSSKPSGSGDFRCAAWPKSASNGRSSPSLTTSSASSTSKRDSGPLKHLKSPRSHPPLPPPSDSSPAAKKLPHPAPLCPRFLI